MHHRLMRTPSPNCWEKVPAGRMRAEQTQWHSLRYHRKTIATTIAQAARSVIAEAKRFIIATFSVDQTFALIPGDVFDPAASICFGFPIADNGGKSSDAGLKKPGADLGFSFKDPSVWWGWRRVYLFASWYLNKTASDSSCLHEKPRTSKLPNVTVSADFKSVRRVCAARKPNSA